MSDYLSESNQKVTDFIEAEILKLEEQILMEKEFIEKAEDNIKRYKAEIDAYRSTLQLLNSKHPSPIAKEEIKVPTVETAEVEDIKLYVLGFIKSEGRFIRKGDIIPFIKNRFKKKQATEFIENFFEEMSSLNGCGLVIIRTGYSNINTFYGFADWLKETGGVKTEHAPKSYNTRQQVYVLKDDSLLRVPTDIVREVADASPESVKKLLFKDSIQAILKGLDRFSHAKDIHKILADTNRISNDTTAKYNLGTRLKENAEEYGLVYLHYPMGVNHYGTTFFGLKEWLKDNGEVTKKYLPNKEEYPYVSEMRPKSIFIPDSI